MDDPTRPTAVGMEGKARLTTARAHSPTLLGQKCYSIERELAQW